MAYSYVSYTADGDTSHFTIPFEYISTDHLRVKLNGVATTEYTLPTASRVALNTKPASGTLVSISRVTPKDDTIVDFVNAALLKASDLNTASLQQLYCLQELIDHALVTNAINEYDAGERVISNVANPTNDLDAANRQWVLALMSGSGNVPSPLSSGKTLYSTGSRTYEWRTGLTVPTGSSATVGKVLTSYGEGDSRWHSLKVEDISDAGTAALRNFGTAQGSLPMLGEGGKLPLSTIPDLTTDNFSELTDTIATVASTNNALAAAAIGADHVKGTY